MLTLRMNRMLPEPSLLTGEIDRVFEALLNSPFSMSTPTAQAIFPALNVSESEDAFLVEAELPGFKMDNLELSLTGDELVISGSREAEKNVENGTFHRRERISGSFSRRIRLGAPIESEKVNATMENGVLSITLPKSAAAKARKITVTSK